MDTIQAPAGTNCPHCGKISRTSDYCSSCSRPLAARTMTPAYGSGALPGSDLAALLNTLAAVILVIGLLTACYCWAEYGTISSGGFFGAAVTVSNPIAKLAAFGIGANSLVWSVLLAGVARAINNTIQLAETIAASPRR